MNRNLNSHFSRVSSIDIQRSVLDVSSSTSTTCNAGVLVPFYFNEVLPGGTYSYRTKFVARLTPSVHATMDTAFIDFYYFFVPNRICWDDWKHFMGEPESYWTPTSTYTVPQIQFPTNGWNSGSIADHFGLPVYVEAPNATDDSNYVQMFPLLGFCHIYNEFFRDENLQAPLYCPTSTTGLSGIQGWQAGSASEVANPLMGAMRGASLPKVCKPHDYFTSALPYPMRSDKDVTIPLASSGSYLPVVTGQTHSYTSTGIAGLYYPLTMRKSDGGTYGNWHNMIVGVSSPDTSFGVRADSSSSVTVDTINDPELLPNNLWASVSSDVTATLNDLRYAFALQHLYEDLARGGARYREILKSIFGVSVEDPNHDVPEYLGGNRVPIMMNSVVQQSETGTTPQGNVTGYSHTTNESDSFTFSSSEHGYIIGVFCIRQPKTYQQGVNKLWRRRDRISYYFPEFANIGEQKIRKDEIYFGAENDDTNSQAFGYQEAWAEYRYYPHTVTGALRSTSRDSQGNPNTLDSWHYADYYASRPQLSDTWIADNSRENIDRTLAVQSSNSDQFIVDIAWKATHVVPMPVYSIPGLTKL